jgi:phage replication O-like protein O
MDTIHEKGASPQVEDGYLKIAHEIAEAFSRIRISGNEWRILWVILRKTYGWNKKMDHISTTQFEKETGLKRRHVSRALSSLIKRRIVTNNGDSFIGTYGLQKDYSRWKTVTKNGDKKRIVTNNGTKPSPIMVNTKALTKTNNGRSKKETDPRVKEFLNYWSETFSREIGQPYTFSFAKEGSLVKRLLQVHSLETLQEMTRAFFKDEQCKRRGLTIGIFFQEINRLNGLKSMNPLEQAKRELQRG